MEIGAISKPRFEFRSFGQNFDEAHARMARLSVPVPEKVWHRTSDEIYIISRANDINNTKIRDGKMDIKTYVQTVDKNFAVLGVSLDRNREQWLAAIEKDKLSWTQVSDLKYWSSDAAVLYCIRWIPMSFLIDPEGKILAIGLEGDELHNKLQELLK